MPLLEKHSTYADIPFSYLEGGQGLPLLMIHGSGPGASTAGNWSKVLDPLSELFSVYAMDLIGFGRSGRKPAPPFFDFDLWIEQSRKMIELIPGEEIGIVGHSISGALALKLAAREPRISKVLTTGCMGAPFVINEDTIRTWTFPRNREELVRTAQCLIHDHRLIDERYLQTREAILFKDKEYADYFATMFAGDKQQYVSASLLTQEELARVRCKLVMMHGRNDRPFPAEQTTLALAKSLPHADIVLLGECSHSIAFEFPEKLVAVAERLFNLPS